MEMDLTGTIPNTSPQQSILRELRKIEGRLQKIETRIDLLEEKPALLEPVKKDNPFELEIGEQYFMIDQTGAGDESEWSDSIYDRNCLLSGNAFKSAELRDRERDKRLLIQEIEKWKFENDEDGAFIGLATIVFNRFYGHLMVYHDTDHDLTGISFKSAAMAESALEHFGDRLKILFLPKYTI